jgi:hypothetical protein
MVGVDMDDDADILERIQQAYLDWDPDLGPDIWKVAKKWLQDHGSP